MSLLPFSDDFARSDGDLANGWDYTAGKWTIASGKAVGTPGLGANLIVNGGFDSDTTWFKESGWTIGSGTGNKAPDVGNKGIRQSVHTANRWYRYDWSIASYTAGAFWAAYFSWSAFVTKAAIGAYYAGGRSNQVSAGIEGNAASNGSIDNITSKEVTLADAFCVREGASDIIVSAPLSNVAGLEQGVVICLDSRTNPKYFILASHVGTRILLTKCVNGTCTELIATSSTAVDGQSIAVTKSGTTVTLYYNEVQIGTPQTVSDAGIISNTLYGMFSTGPEGSFVEISAVNP